MSKRYEVIMLNYERSEQELKDILGGDYDAFIYDALQDYRTALVIKVDGIVETLQIDGGEPEDNSFTRDWSWVDGALKEAYHLGMKHAKEELQ